jgi:predicted AAA+ superfamily ATPase
VLIYATSNRRHLPERMSDNMSYKHDEDGDLHPGETVEEKISLSERFGLWLTFYPFKQDDYLAIVAHWLSSLGCTKRRLKRRAPMRCAGPCSAARARAAWRGSSPRITQGSSHEQAR